MQLTELMDGLAGRLGVSSFAPEDDGSFAMTFDGHLSVRCAPEGSEAIRLVGMVGAAPGNPQQRGAALRRLLRSSLARAGSEAPILALDAGTGELILHRRLPAGDLQLDGFERAMEAFLNRLADCQRQLAAEAASPPLPLMMFR